MDSENGQVEPKKHLPSEVRCTEQAKGGLKYELVLSKPSIEEAPKIASPPKSNLSVEEIQNKLKAAEERRLSLEAKRLNQITEQLSHLEFVKEKKEEFNNNFMQSTRESLEQKMESIKENREAYLKSIKEKVRDHVSKVEEIKKMGDTPPRNDDAQERLKKKLEGAAAYREEQMNALLQRLKEHDNHISEVRGQMEASAKNLKERHAKKLQDAQEKREALYKFIQEKSKEHEKHINDIKRQYEEYLETLKEKQNKKQESAKEKREAVIRDIQEKIMEHKSRVLQVRQTNILNQQQEVESKLQHLSEKLSAAESKRLIQHQIMQEKLLQHERHAEEVRRKAGSLSGSMVIENSSG